MIEKYKENGYVVVKNFVNKADLQILFTIACQFHHSWQQENIEFYAKKVINCAYLTSPKYLSNNDRQSLFKFIASTKMMNIVNTIIGERSAFMNTQLFFNPLNKSQKNYWHRDSQYHLSIKEQKLALSGPKVVHFRIPLADEPGIELIPGTHLRWDTINEQEIRLEQNGHRNDEDIALATTVKLNAGDLLIFDANMIHRGLYGMKRLALDILFCDAVPELVAFVDDDCLPDANMLTVLENTNAFNNVVKLKNNNEQ
jgi:ectoine hydroxylase-related dioxygenase (phytanoyl-CoA dioxygenase family)